MAVQFENQDPFIQFDQPCTKSQHGRLQLCQEPRTHAASVSDNQWSFRQSGIRYVCIRFLLYSHNNANLDTKLYGYQPPSMQLFRRQMGSKNPYTTTKEQRRKIIYRSK